MSGPRGEREAGPSPWWTELSSFSSTLYPRLPYQPTPTSQRACPSPANWEWDGAGCQPCRKQPETTHHPALLF